MPKASDPTTAAARKSARNAQKLAEQEEAEIISNLPRHSKEKTKQKKPWNRDSTNAEARKRAFATDSDDNAAAEDILSKRSSKKPRKESSKKATKTATQDQMQHQAAAKQKPAAKRRVLSHHALDGDSDNEPPLSPKAVLTKPKRGRKLSDNIAAAAKASGHQLSRKGNKSVHTKTDSEAEQDNEEDDEDNTDHDRVLLRPQDDSGSEEEDNDDEDIEDLQAEIPRKVNMKKQNSGVRASATKVIATDSDSSSSSDSDDDDIPLSTTNHIQRRRSSSSSMGLNRIRLNSPESSDNEVNVPHTQATSDDQVLDTNKGTNNTATEDMQEPSNVDLFDEEVELSSEDDAAETNKRKRKSLTSKAPKKARKSDLTEKEARKQKDERPRFKKSGANVEPALNDLQKRLQAVRQIHADRRTLENVEAWEHDYPRATRIKYSNARLFALKSQRETVQSVAYSVIEHFTNDTVFHHGIYDSSKRFTMQREICIDAAKKLNQHEIAARMVIDANYAKLFTELGETRNIQARTAIRDIARHHIATEYGLDASTPQTSDMTATRVKALKVGMGYAYPSDILVAIDGNLPFKRPIFAKVIYEAFFQRGEKGKAALATGKEDVFTSSVYLKPHEKEMIPNIVALACAGIFLSLDEWTSGSLV